LAEFGKNGRISNLPKPKPKFGATLLIIHQLLTAYNEKRRQVTTTRSCRDPETAVSIFWSTGVRGRPQRVPSAGSGWRRLLLLPSPVQLLLPLYIEMGDKNSMIIN